MRNITKSFLIAGAALALSSCSHRLVGTWNVEKYETGVPGSQTVSLTNIGNITFNRNNSGEKNLNYQVMGIQRNDQIPFQWNATDGYVTLTSDKASEFSKTWIILENKRKFQKWKSTDGTNNVQVIELKK